MDKLFVGNLLSCLIVSLAACQPITADTGLPRRPFPQHVTYATGTIRPDHRSQAQQDDDVRAFYDHWKTSYLREAGTTDNGQLLYRVSFGSTDPERTVSEGQGYGMVIIALMAGYDPDAHEIFDGLWAFRRAYPSSIDSRLMGWQVPVGEGNDSAFDGDADIAYGLLLADAQWGSRGRNDYRAAAQEVIAGILESTIGPESRLPMLGDWVDPNSDQYNQYTPRSSDFMPAHFRAYGRATSDEVWTKVIAQTQAVITHLQEHDSPATGLLPDFIVPLSATDHTPRPAPPDFLEGATDGDYYYNAGRTPWRIGVDALLNGDSVSLAQVRKITNWAQTATGGDPQKIKPGYQLSGEPIPPGEYFTTFFAAPLGVAAMTEPSQQAWLNAIYDAVYATHEDYYEDSVTLLCLLVMSGNYWDPTAAPAG
jgi:endo-1,4-beta-D-glucanase Y